MIVKKVTDTKNESCDRKLHIESWQNFEINRLDRS